MTELDQMVSDAATILSGDSNDLESRFNALLDRVPEDQKEQFFQGILEKTCISEKELSALYY